MATSMKSIQFVIFLIVMTLLVASSEARISPEFSTMIRKKVHTKIGLRELINNVRSGEWHQTRSMLGGRLQRVSPADQILSIISHAKIIKTKLIGETVSNLPPSNGLFWCHSLFHTFFINSRKPSFVSTFFLIVEKLGKILASELAQQAMSEQLGRYQIVLTSLK
ncbi:hypothetical protein JHK85_016594 [Glycine max]|nr:hypothetical protein JHK85_016594 [Glycine max]